MRSTAFLFLLKVFGSIVYLVASSAHCQASLVANDSAADPAYDGAGASGWDINDNGGTGFGAWTTINNGGGGGFGGGFINRTGTSIDVGGEAFGLFGNSGGIGQAIRNFTGDLSIGQTFSIDMDNQAVNDGAVGFGLRNSSGNNLFEFFLTASGPNYTVSADNVIGSTPAETTDGLNLEFQLTDADSFSLKITELATGGSEFIVTGDLFSNADQGIEQLRLFNGNGGPDVFFNSFSVSAVPEPSAFLFGGLVCGVLGLNYTRKRRGQVCRAA